MIAKRFAKKSSTHIMALMLILASLTAISLHSIIVKANPITIDVSPSTAPVGSMVRISGINATPNDEVRIYVLGFVFLANTMANETGGYSVDVSAPAVPAGIYSITALDVATGDTAAGMLTVQPRILLSMASGSFGDRVSAKGAGFQSGSNVTLTFDGMDITPMPQPVTDFMGSFEANFYVPSIPNSTYSVTADDIWGNTASADFIVSPKLTFFSTGSSDPSTLVIINGFGFAPSVNVTIYFDAIDVTPYPVVITSPDGSFGIPIFIPQVANGMHTINASDTTGNWAASLFVVGPPILTLAPDQTSTLSIVTAEGRGFPQHTPIVLHLEDITLTNIVDLMWMSANLITDDTGFFAYSFVVPITEPGIYNVVAFSISGPGPSEPKRVASAFLTIIDNSPVDTEVKVGSIHFRGEMAEFYVETAFDGNLVNATIDKATLYYSNGTQNIDLTADVEQVTTGLYRIAYAIPGNATLGTYTLLVETSYTTGFVEAHGSSFANFILSPTFTSNDAQLISIENDIGTIIIPDLGTIKADLDTVNARLTALTGTMATVQTDIGTIKTDIATIQLRITSINGTIATIQTTLGTIQGRVTAIEGNTATISTDLGTVKANVESVASEVTPAGFELDVTTLVLAFVAAAGSILGWMAFRRTKSTTSTSPPTPEPPPPPTLPTP